MARSTQKDADIAYDKAEIAAMAAFNEIMVLADKAYDEAVAAYDAASDEANAAFNNIMAAADAVHEKATTNRG